MIKTAILILASTVLALSQASAAAAPAAKKSKPPVELDGDCLKALKQTLSASMIGPADIEEDDVTVSSVVVTEVGTIEPSEYSGPVAFAGVFALDKQPSGTFSARMNRGGCEITGFQK